MSTLHHQISNKVLFLDIDGVVLSGKDLYSSQEFSHLPPNKVSKIHKILDETGAKLVISSSWRHVGELSQKIQEVFGTRLHLDWCTPTGMKIPESSLIVATTRGNEIKQWLDSHPEIEYYAIVDDDSDMLHEQLPFFVCTTFMDGIQDYHVEELIGILNERE